MTKCDCGREFETATKLQIHRLSGNCPRGKPLRAARPTGAVVRKPVRRLRTGEELEAQARKDMAKRHSSWHIAISVYYKAYGVKQREPGHEVSAHLGDVDRAIKAAIMTEEFRDLVNAQLDKDIDDAWGWKDAVDIVKARIGYNTAHCHLNQQQQLLKARHKAKKK